MSDMICSPLRSCAPFSQACPGHADPIHEERKHYVLLDRPVGVGSADITLFSKASRNIGPELPNTTKVS